MGNTSTKISIPILAILRYQVFLKNRNFNSCDHVMVAFEVTEHNGITSINHLKKFYSKIFQIKKVFRIALK